MDQDQKKLNAARASLDYIESGIVLGVGTGSTVNHLIELLPSVKDKIQAVVSSSIATTALLTEHGFEVSLLNAVGVVDLYIDGADEASKRRELIKGGGGALTREKVIAGASRRFICIIDDSKQVGMLGTFPLPLEVIPMAQSQVIRNLTNMGGHAVWRDEFVTDNGNHILDIHNLKITNPIETETRINQIPGVVTVGLFAHFSAYVLLVFDEKGIINLGM